MVDQFIDLKELDDYQLENDSQDLRGRALRAYDGTRIGTVQRMLVDPEKSKVAALVLEDGRGVPVEDIEIRDGEAFIDPVQESRYFQSEAKRHNVARGPVTVRMRHKL
ncbi:PRC-barrel domain-containing protein [Novosphingobium aquimarinum]|uniref:PRC-barrel domain-containing protein n=1 Tax=Novosphingobium aquimarinum TaxID=2682494 RepID=UPI0012EB07F0|nr:PRC-barrel domain-containing protein [Novosphingobium aquimarinum]